MTCRDFIELLGRALPGERTGDAAVSEFDGHLRDCPDCAAYLRSYEATIRLARGAYAARKLPVTEELVQAIVSRVCGTKSR